MTGKPVDLVAVAVARERLAALAAAHPALFTAEARARLIHHATGVSPMPGRLDPDDPESTLIAVRLTKQLTAILDAEVIRQRRATPDVGVSRSTVIRGLLRRLQKRTAKAPKAAP